MLLDEGTVSGTRTGAKPGTRTAEETERIRLTLRARFDELTAEYEEEAARGQVMRLVEVSDSAGDDQADSGSKAAERDAARSVLRTILDRRTQFEHALARLDAGGYGYCETCAKPIPVERLEIFPSATTCVACKQRGERRAA